MVHRCCISSCGMSVRVVEAKGLSYHKFPTKETVRDQWVQAIIPHLDKPESFKVVPRYTRVCSRHFRKKDYCMDAKKRARLISNAVPSVFPRKNTPLVIPTVLPVSPKQTNSKPQATVDNVPGPSFNSKSNNKTVLISGNAGTCSASTPNINDCAGMQPKEIDSKELDDILGRRELVIESAAIQDDHLVLTVMDSVSQVVDLECISLANSDDPSQESSTIKIDDANGGTKRRKRRKWNRTAFARPAKGKRKSLSLKPELSGDQDFNESLSDIVGEFSEDTYIEVKHERSTSVGERRSASTTTPASENDSLSNVTLMLSDLPNQSYQTASVEQELLQSIQAVSLRCVGDHEDVGDASELHDTSADEVYQYNSHLVPAFLHHHSSEESLFSNESQNASGGLGDSQLSMISQSDVTTEDDSLRFELVDLRIDPDMPSSQAPSYLDIDELAHQLNSSLFTDGKIPLFSTDNLTLNEEAPSDLTLADPLLVTPETISKEDTVKSATNEKISKQSIKKGSSKKNKGYGKEGISPKEKKLKGVSKRPKKDKVAGKFSVERFKNSDKDIEYYTGFNSYRNFEAFFRSLEAYIEKICITDVTYGVNNLPAAATEKGASCSTSATSEGALQKVNDPPKKRPCQGRAMSRINELFMTIIRLRRKLPEKVLGHMFFISQPTVSRVVRAWTVLLSKIIDSYPVESSLSSSSAYQEHSYTSKGLGIPDSFRDLFHSDLAKSIVVTSLNPKKMKSKASNTAQCTRNKKSKKNTVASTPAKKEDCVNVNESRVENLMNVSLSADFFLGTVEKPEPIEQLRIFDD